MGGNVLDEALHDNTRSPVPEQAAFRIDLPALLAGLGDRDRRVARDMALGHRTQEVAAMHGLSEGRVSQMRRQFKEGWEQFCGPDELTITNGLHRAANAVSGRATGGRAPPRGGT